MSSSAFSLTVMVPADGLQVIAGEPAICGARTPGLEHYGCPDCFSWVFTRIAGPDGYLGFVNVRPTMFDRPAWGVPFIETMMRDKLDWASTPAPHKYEGFPPEEEFGRLIQAFAAERADAL